MSIATLISEMQEVKAENSALSIDQVLQIFNIAALQDLAHTIRSKA